MTTIVVEMPDEVRAMLDEARGEQDLATFLLTAGERAARQRLRRGIGNQHSALTDELTAADHLRMAADAEADAVDLDEFKRVLYERLAQQKAARALEGNQ